MKILHLSDLHLEFGNMDLPSTEGVDVVVLSGDIHIGSRGIDFAAQFDVPVVITLGNHEGYCLEDLDSIIEECRTKASQLDNVFFLENDCVVINSVRFHGCLFWTDFDLYSTPDLSMNYAHKMMNDFRKISYYGQHFTPSMAAEIHKRSRKWLFDSISQSPEERNVIVTHHLPTPTAIADQYKGSELSPAFASDCSEFTKLADKVALWLYGHNHECRTFTENGIMFSTNQRGYAGIDPVPGFDPQKVIKI
ncbi:metallophosphoesterase [Photobacterium sp. ZSDE20]|uniref:Metallophosphoesterase n=1 Tax=Photobacterium pectinilyticum TaxID=2906793 RepID=A0ABT1NCM5_9GAMM|nr:metallophosphoesterase [Photobacterium sp. ZSDE20]MCQ1061089.1 metallophosphoesterase [Photobacterium sp. ZSDE20]MDD1826192.1 metallophosphoesterase [Photobacterium sp. ZSDE20]